MKNIFYSLFAATALLATSCSQSEEPVAAGETVDATFQVGLAGVQTRAIGDGSSVNELVYAVYDEAGTTKVVDNATATISNKAATVKIPLVKGEKYKVVFWAQTKSAYTTTDLTAIPVPTTATANNESRDAFFAAVDVTAGSGTATSVTLTRPFAQLNVMNTTADESGAAALGIEVAKSAVTVKGLATTFNALTGEASGSADATFSLAAIPTENITVSNTTYNHLAMNYVLASGEKSTHDVSVTLADADGETVATWSTSSVPLQRNYRTNVQGTLLSTGDSFTITIDAAFAGDLN